MTPRRQSFHSHMRHQQNHRQSPRLQLFLDNRIGQLNDISNHICEFAQDRDGSKFIQRKLDEAPDHRKKSIFNEIHTQLNALMMHRFANFVIQKYFHIGNEDQRAMLYRHIKVHFFELSRNKYGCRVVQKAIEQATTLQLFCLLEEFTEQNVLTLVLDANGNHVIQNIFRTAASVPNRHIQDVLFDRIETHVKNLFHHLYGCRVIQCVLQHGSAVHRDRIFDEIWTNPVTIIRHRYGNYVVQNLTRNCSPPQQNRLIQFVLVNVIAFSTDKYASNVVEACICLATPLQRYEAMEIICELDPSDLKRFCIDASANYVVQKLMNTATTQQMNTLFVKMSPFFHQIKRYVCGRKIIDKLESNTNVIVDNLSVALRDLFIYKN